MDRAFQTKGKPGQKIHDRKGLPTLRKASQASAVKEECDPRWGGKAGGRQPDGALATAKDLHSIVRAMHPH